MNLSSVLQQNGLSLKEAQIYLAMLELKEALPSTIARRSGIKRPTTYVLLEEMQQKGLVGHIKRGKLLFYSVVDPRMFVESQHHKYRELERSLPELLKLHSRFEAVPQMTLFEGKEGLIKIMEDTLKTSNEILVWANADLAATTNLLDYYPNYIAKKVRNGIWSRAILGYDERALQFKKKEKEELREVRLIPKDKFPFKNEINIYDNKMAILSHQDEIGVIIENKNMADTQRSIFNFCFEYAKIVETSLYLP